MSEAVMLDGEQEQMNDGFVILDDSSAEWAIRRIKDARERAEAWEAFYKAQIKRAKDDADRTEAFLTERLKEYFQMVPHNQAKTQESYPLPSGKLVFKQVQPKYEPDDAELVPWLEQNSMTELVKVKKSANWDGLKKLVEVTPDGKAVMMKDGKEVVPGVRVTPQEPVFKIEIKY